MQINSSQYINEINQLDSSGSIYCQKWENIPLENFFLSSAYINYSKKDSKAIQEIVISEKTIPEEGFSFVYHDFLLIAMIFAFSMLAYVSIKGRNYFNRLFMSVINYSYAISFFRERNLSFVLYNNIMMLILYISIGIQLVEIFAFFSIPLPDYDPKLVVLMYSGVVALFIFGMRMVMQIGGWIFGSTKIASEFIFYFFSLLQVSALFYLVLSVLMIFIDKDSEFIFIYGSIFITAIIYFIKLIRIFIIFFSNRFSLYYLILYLCALEIIPVLLLVKVLRRFIQNGYIIG